MDRDGFWTVAMGFMAILIVVFFEISNRVMMARLDDRLRESELKVEELDKRVVGRGPNGWHKPNMVEWQIEFQRLNPGVKLPDLRITEGFNSTEEAK